MRLYALLLQYLISFYFLSLLLLLNLQLFLVLILIFKAFQKG
ncbi:hypothetical protein MCHI_000408 [Candidatus Magnetoovum chiemensis]|nr:hypothetical protein MCHI_000408 [Candidatus Magnetoovum chiemensis]